MEQVAITFPSGEKATREMGLRWASTSNRSPPELGTHAHSLASLSTAASNPPSGEKATPATADSGPLRLLIAAQSSALYRSTPPMAVPPEASTAPSGEKARAVTSPR